MRSLQEEGIYRTNESGEMMPAEDNLMGGSTEEYSTHRLFFHAGYRVQLLFYDWVPHSRLTYGLSLAAVVILALFYEWFGELRRRSISMLDSPPAIFLAPEPISNTGAGAAAASAATSSSTHSSSSKHLGAIGSFNGRSATAALLRQPSHIVRRHFRRLLQHRHVRLLLVTLTYVLHSAAGYLLMLLVMTFNVGVFFAVLFGLALGFFLFRVNHLQDSTT